MDELQATLYAHFAQGSEGIDAEALQKTAEVMDIVNILLAAGEDVDEEGVAKIAQADDDVRVAWLEELEKEAYGADHEGEAYREDGDIDEATALNILGQLGISMDDLDEANIEKESAADLVSALLIGMQEADAAVEDLQKMAAAEEDEYEEEDKKGKKGKKGKGGAAEALAAMLNPQAGDQPAKNAKPETQEKLSSFDREALRYAYDLADALGLTAEVDPYTYMKTAHALHILVEDMYSNLNEAE